MVEKITGEVENLQEVLERWLEYGLKMPVSHEYAISLAPVCVEALKEVNDYRMKTLIKLPIGIHITWLETGERTNLCPAYVIVARFDLTNWLKKGWNIQKHNAEIEKEKNEIPNSE